MHSSQWTNHPAFMAQFAHSASAAKSRALADALMGWGHATGFCGSLVGIAGGFGLALGHGDSGLLSATLFGGPVAGLVVSGLLYIGAWYADHVADQQEAIDTKVDTTW